MVTSLKTSFVRNIGFNSAARITTFVLSGITNIVLARYLSSSDYGIVSFALIIINLFAQFNDFGINSAVIQRAQLDDKALYTGFTIKILLGGALFGGALILAPLSTYFFREPAVVDVIRLLSLNLLLNGLMFVPTTLLTRELDFRKIMIYQIWGSIAGSSVTILLALRGFNYWSVAIGNVGAALVSAIVINMLKPARMRFAFDKPVFFEFMQFGGKIFVSQIVVFAILNIDNLIVGAIAGADALGYYALAFNWGALISTVSAAVILSVLFPTFTKFQNDRNKIKEVYLKVMGIVAFISVMANLCLLVGAREFLFFILGHGTDKWLPALVIFKIFCVYGIGRAILEPVGSMIMAIGRTELFLKSTILTGFIEISLLYPALQYFGITGVAVLVTFSYMLQYFIYFPALRKEIGLEFRDIFKAVRPSIAAGLCTWIAIELFVGLKGEVEPAMLLFALKLFISLAGYIFIHGLLSNWQLFKDARSILRNLHISR